MRAPPGQPWQISRSRAFTWNAINVRGERLSAKTNLFLLTLFFLVFFLSLSIFFSLSFCLSLDSIRFSSSFTAKLSLLRGPRNRQFTLADQV